MTVFKEVNCPLFLRRFRRGKLISILCEGQPETHILLSFSVEEREKKIENVCNNYEKCKHYQNYE
jgi:hypothetical protein